MTTKKYKKILMSMGFDRNFAEKLRKECAESRTHYASSPASRAYFGNDFPFYDNGLPDYEVDAFRSLRAIYHGSLRKMEQSDAEYRRSEKEFYYHEN